MTDAAQMVQRRDALLDKLIALAKADTRIQACWLQGSLARGSDDAFSDIDAYLAVDDDALDVIWKDRATFLAQIARPLAWSDATFPGLKAIHALLENGVKLDLFFEPASKLDQQKRPAVRVLYDRGNQTSQLKTGWEAPIPTIAHIVTTIIKMTRQGATWPLRLINRGQWSTLAMMELDLINAQIAQLMAIQNDPGHFYMNAFSHYRLLTPAQQAEIDRLTQHALAAVTAHNNTALKVVHLEVFDALVREGRAACTALNIHYPVNDDGDRDLRALLEREWPG